MSSQVEKLSSLQIGQMLLVETNAGELLAGTLKSINTKYCMVELDNVRDIKSNYTYQSSQILAYTQMKNIKLILDENIKTEDDRRCESSTSSSSIIGMGSSTESQEKSDGLKINLNSSDLQLIQKQLDTTILITQTDHKYHKALNDIKSQSIVGFLVDPVEMGRHCKTSLVAISTSQNIYIFDMLAIGKIFKEMRLILEAERPRKAVHFSHKTTDHLKYRHKILLKGVFDTFLAYCLVTNEKTNITFEETIQKTFSLPRVYFDANCENEIPVNAYQRPLSQDQRMSVAKKVAFQLKLSDYLLHECMLRNFYDQCEKFSQTFCNDNDNFQVGQQLHSRSHAGYDHIQPTGNWKEKLNIDWKLLNKQEQDLDNINFLLK